MTDKQREKLEKVIKQAGKIVDFGKEVAKYPADYAVDCGVPEEHERLFEELQSAVNEAAQQAAGAEPVGVVVSTITQDRTHGADSIGQQSLKWVTQISVNWLKCVSAGDKLYAESQPPKAVPDGWSDLVSDLACALYAAVNAGRLDEEDVINYQNDQIKTTVGSLLDRANEMLTDHPGPSTTAFDDQEAPDE